MTRWSILLFSVVLTLSCDSDTIPPDPDVVGYSYFPLEVGMYRDYQVHREEFSLFGSSDTADFQLREQVVDSFGVGEQITYIIHRSTRQTSDDPWDLDSVWTARRTPQHAIMVENNIPFAKLVFPLALNNTWDGNIFNSRDEDQYQVSQVDGTMETPAGKFNQTLTVLENNEPDTLIFQDIRQVVYAREIGVIYKNSSILDFCNTEPSCLGMLEVGIKFEQILIDYGRE